MLSLRHQRLNLLTFNPRLTTGVDLFPTPMNKRYWIIGIVVVVAAVLLYFLLHEPKQTDSHTDDYERVLASGKKLLADHAVTLKKIDSLEASGHAKDSTIAALKADKATTQRALDKTSATASRLAKEVKELSRPDTTEFGRKCDSLADAAENFAYLYGQYKDVVDSLNMQVEQQGADYLKALTEQKRLYAELKVQYDLLMDAYKTLADDYVQARKTIKRERLKTKIAALMALVAGGAALLK
jgi:chromosome segregation ATPase